MARQPKQLSGPLSDYVAVKYTSGRSEGKVRYWVNQGTGEIVSNRLVANARLSERLGRPEQIGAFHAIHRKAGKSGATLTYQQRVLRPEDQPSTVLRQLNTMVPGDRVHVIVLIESDGSQNTDNYEVVHTYGPAAHYESVVYETRQDAKEAFSNAGSILDWAQARFGSHVASVESIALRTFDRRG